MNFRLYVIDRESGYYTGYYTKTVYAKDTAVITGYSSKTDAPLLSVSGFPKPGKVTLSISPALAGMTTLTRTLFRYGGMDAYDLTGSVAPAGWEFLNITSGEFDSSKFGSDAKTNYNGDYTFTFKYEDGMTVKFFVKLRLAKDWPE